MDEDIISPWIVTDPAVLTIAVGMYFGSLSLIWLSRLGHAKCWHPLRLVRTLFGWNNRCHVTINDDLTVNLFRWVG